MNFLTKYPVYVWLWLLSVVVFLRLFHVEFHHHTYIGAFL